MKGVGGIGTAAWVILMRPCLPRRRAGQWRDPSSLETKLVHDALATHVSSVHSERVQTASALGGLLF
jgi:hypothetical protein